MGRFSDAKPINDNPTVIQRSINYLIDLLDRGYSTELNINGHVIKISIDPKQGIIGSNDGVQMFGINPTTGQFIIGKYDTDISTVAGDLSDLSIVVNSKRTVFTTQPTTPYYIGDLWLTSIDDFTGDLKKCATQRLTGAYVATDWLVALGAVEVSKLGTTIITDNYLLTSLIASNSITSDKINVTDLVAERIMTVAESNNYGEIGDLSGRGVGLDLLVGGVSFVSIVKTATGGFAFYDGVGEHQRMLFSNTGLIQLNDHTGLLRMSLTSDGGAYFYDESGEGRFYCLTDGSFHIKNSGSTKSTLSITPTSSELHYAGATNNAIGADATGAFYVTAGTKTYFGSESESWIAPTLLNSWANKGSPHDVAGYYRDKMGVVHLKGAVVGGAVGSVIFQLPVGYRNSLGLQIISAVANGVSGTLSVDTSGNVGCFAAVSVSSYFSISGVTFRTNS